MTRPPLSCPARAAAAPPRAATVRRLAALALGGLLGLSCGAPQSAVVAAEVDRVQGPVMHAKVAVAAAPKASTAVPTAKPAVPVRAPIRGGYVLTHEHPTNGMAFGGNYSFAGKAGNYKNGVMEKGYTAACGGCKAGKKCDHGEAKGNLTAALGALGSDMGDHKSHLGPVHDSNSHLRYSTEWIKAAAKDTKDSRLKIMVAFAVESEAMCEQLYAANRGN
ncbi:MAG: hypothetical protein AAF721_37195, partial [Myxococcota bacterium]